MAILGAFKDADIWVGPTDLSNFVNEVDVEADVVPLDATTFGSGGWNAYVGGLRSAKVDIKGYNSFATVATDPDPLIQPLLGTKSNCVTIIPTTAAVAGVCYFGTFLAPTYKTGGKVGDLMTFETNPVADAPLVRGQVANTTALTSTSTTTILNLGTTPTANQAVYCNLHILTAAGTTPSMTVVLQGATTLGFGSPSTIATSSAINAVGSVKLQGATGATSNQYYRLSVTITGTGGPSFLTYAAIGIA